MALFIAIAIFLALVSYVIIGAIYASKQSSLPSWIRTLFTPYFAITGNLQSTDNLPTTGSTKNSHLPSGFLSNLEKTNLQCALTLGVYDTVAQELDGVNYPNIYGSSTNVNQLTNFCDLGIKTFQLGCPINQF